jgi:hypothetical protein
MGQIQQGVRKSLRDLGIIEPQTAIEMLAILIAEVLDDNPDDKTVAALSRELRSALTSRRQKTTRSKR